MDPKYNKALMLGIAAVIVGVAAYAGVDLAAIFTGLGQLVGVGTVE